MDGSRSRVLLANMLAGFFGRALNLLSNLIIIPISLSALGQEQYGLLAVVISIGVFFTYGDFGLGSALVNDVATAGKDGTSSARIAISQVWYFLLAIAVLVTIAGVVTYFAGGARLAIPGVPDGQLAAVWFMLLIGSASGIPFAIAQRIYFATQRGTVAQVWIAATRLAVLGGAVLASILSPRLETFVFVVVVVPSLVAGLNVGYLFWRNASLRPAIKMVSSQGLWSRVKVGIVFGAMNLFTFTEIGLDPLLFAHHFSLSQVAENDVVVRLFSYVPSLISIALVPLWPALASAIGTSDPSWARKTARLAAVGTGAASALSCAALLLFLDMILTLWLGQSQLHNDMQRLLIAIFIALQSYGLYQLYTMNALGLIRVSASLSILFAVIVMPIKIFVIDYSSSMAASYAVLIVWYLAKIAISQFAIEARLKAPSQPQAQV